MGYLDMIREAEEQPSPSWSSDQEKAAKEIHDQSLRRLAAEVPAGCLRWAREHRPDLWIAVEDSYQQVQAAFASEDFPGTLAAVREFEVANLTLFRVFQESQPPLLRDMPPEAEAVILRVFGARPVESLPAQVNTIA